MDVLKFIWRGLWSSRRRSITIVAVVALSTLGFTLLLCAMRTLATRASILDGSLLNTLDWAITGLALLFLLQLGALLLSWEILKLEGQQERTRNDAPPQR
jgi:hypothetical protein